MPTYDQVVRWAKISQSNARMSAVAGHAAPYLMIDAAALDMHVQKLNVRNGTIIFEKVNEKWRHRLAPHDPDDLMTKAADVDYDPDATCPTYDEALALVQPDLAVRAFLHRVIGSMCTGMVRDQKVFFFYGNGRNGKSTFVDIWARILGDYASTIPIERFLHSGQSGDAGRPSPDLAGLRGVRMVRTSEPERGNQLAESMIKLVTSGEPLLVRELHRPMFHLHPQFKIVVSGNYKPVIRGTDDGIWRRMVLIYWPVKVSEAERDPDLAEKLSAERSGILNRMIAGTLDWLESGLAIPPQIEEATAEYRESSDQLGQFLSDCVVGKASARVAAAKLHSVYQAWGRHNGMKPWTQNGFGRAMAERGYRKVKSGTYFWVDIELVRSESDFRAEPEAPNEPADNAAVNPADDEDIPF